MLDDSYKTLRIGVYFVYEMPQSVEEGIIYVLHFTNPLQNACATDVGLM
jgi:hypothetical protein